MVANILPTDLPSTQRAGSKGQTIFFSESSHFAYQIKGNRAQSTIGMGSKRYFFFFSKSGHDAYQIKLEEV